MDYGIVGSENYMFLNTFKCSLMKKPDPCQNHEMMKGFWKNSDRLYPTQDISSSEAVLLISPTSTGGSIETEFVVKLQELRQLSDQKSLLNAHSALFALENCFIIKKIILAIIIKFLLLNIGLLRANFFA
jgi:hypothetical protein